MLAQLKKDPGDRGKLPQTWFTQRTEAVLRLSIDGYPVSSTM